mmetsp:Transcript_1091/g.4430  ORF Transcript_1091/g.4430 Transcript_1091/m.4430 type:complete len:260 (-) Transcript_1091:397-1176(-)
MKSTRRSSSASWTRWRRTWRWRRRGRRCRATCRTRRCRTRRTAWWSRFRRRTTGPSRIHRPRRRGPRRREIHCLWRKKNKMTGTVAWRARCKTIETHCTRDDRSRHSRPIPYVPLVTHAPANPSHSNPPSTPSVCPVTYPLAPIAKKQIALAISSGIAHLPSGVAASALRKLSRWCPVGSSSTVRRSSGVQVTHGATQLTRILGAHSHARVLVSWTTPALDTAYAAPLPVLSKPAADATLTMVGREERASKGCAPTHRW